MNNQVLSESDLNGLIKKTTPTFSKDSFINALSSTFIIMPNLEEHHVSENLFHELSASPVKIITFGKKRTRLKERAIHLNNLFFLPLSTKNSYISLCNQGIRFALENSATFICLLNAGASISFIDIKQLLKTLCVERNIGACSPVKIFQNDDGTNNTARRVSWMLQECRFKQDIHISAGDRRLLESDFCELDCVVFPASLFQQVGLFDEYYDTSTAAMDFGYRLWQHNYRAVYEQTVKITALKHDVPVFEASDECRRYFVNKHLNHGVNYARHGREVSLSWQVIDENFHHYLNQYGLIDTNKPELFLAHPGNKIPYLFTVWETSELPEQWKASMNQYEHVFVPSRWNENVFQRAGCKNISMVPFGVCPDIYHPFGPALAFEEEKAFLVVCQYQYRKALDVTINAWLEMKNRLPRACLYLFKHGLSDQSLLGLPEPPYVRGKLRYHRYLEHQIVCLEPLEKLSSLELAELYRGAHVLINNSRSEGFGFPIIEAMACGTLTIVPNYSATEEFIDGMNCLSLEGYEQPADYSDMGFQNVGNWWEPSIGHLKELLLMAYHIPERDKQLITQKARQFILANYTWRSSMCAMKAALQRMQTPDKKMLLVIKNKKNRVRLPKRVINFSKRVSQFDAVVKQQGYRVALTQTLEFFDKKLNIPLLNSVSNALKKKNAVKEAISTNQFLERLELSDKGRYPDRDRWYSSAAPKISLLVLNYNKPDITLRCIKEIWRHTRHYTYEIILIDNGSELGAFQSLQQIDENFCRIIRLNTNRYFPEGNNIAAQYAKGEYLICLNNDAFVTPNWLEPLISLAEHDNAIGIIGPMFLYPDGRLQEAGASVDSQGMTRLIGEGGDASDPQYTVQKEVDYVSGACLLIKKRDFESVLGFDTFYGRGYYEDVDLTLKIKLLKKKIVYCPASKIIHIKGFTASGYSAMLYESIRKNHAKFVCRWQPYLAHQITTELENDLLLNYIPKKADQQNRRTIGIYCPSDLAVRGNERILLSIAAYLSHENKIVLLFSEHYSQLALQVCLHELGLESGAIDIERLDDSQGRHQFDIFIAAGHDITPMISPRGNKNFYMPLFPQRTEDVDHEASYLNEYDSFFVSSNYCKQLCEETFVTGQLPNKPITILFTPSIKQNEITPVLQAKNEVISILVVGNFYYNSQKNHLYLINAFNTLHTMLEENQQIALHMVGNIHDIDYFSELKNSIKTASIHLHPNVSAKKLQALFKTSDIYWHAIGVDMAEKIKDCDSSLVDAISYGCVPVIHAKGGAVEIIRDEQDGMHYHTDLELLNKTKELIDNAALRSTLSLQAMDRAKFFSEESFIERVNAVLLDVSHC